MKLLLIFLILPSTAFANDVIGCDPTHPLVPNAVTRFEKTVDFPETSGFLVWIAPNNLMTSEKQTYMNQLRGQIDSLLAIPPRYWLCTDTNPVDGILESVREMTPAEKTALDAPDVAEQQRQATLATERTTNDLCTAELNEITQRIDTRVATLQTQLDATTTQAQVKAHLRNELYPALGNAFKQVARCLKARTDRGQGQ